MREANKDIKEAIPEMLSCILKPENTPETVHRLAGVVFVSDIYSDALAIMCPLLKRGLDENVTATKRNVARIIENMAKLVDDPYEVEPFIPLLLPQLVILGRPLKDAARPGGGRVGIRGVRLRAAAADLAEWLPQASVTRRGFADGAERRRR